MAEWEGGELEPQLKAGAVCPDLLGPLSLFCFSIALDATLLLLRSLRPSSGLRQRPCPVQLPGWHRVPSCTVPLPPGHGPPPSWSVPHPTPCKPSLLKLPFFSAHISLLHVEGLPSRRAASRQCPGPRLFTKMHDPDLPASLPSSTPPRCWVWYRDTKVVLRKFSEELLAQGGK